MITDYRVLQETNAEKLQDEVNRAIRNGWQPLGGVCVIKVIGDMWMYQAVVRIANG